MEDLSPLNSLLEKVAIYHPLYGGGLAAHLPMVLIALTKLEASNEKLLNTFNKSSLGLELTASLKHLDAVNDIETELGNIESYNRYLKYYQKELMNNGVQAVLEKSLPILVSGIAASAFHGLIRLAYAIEANCHSEIAIALAYWSAEYQAFELSEDRVEESCEEILSRLSPLGENFSFSPGIIVNRMGEIGALLKHHESVIQPASIDLATLRQFALKAFYLRNDFTLLHTVTGCHAFSIILPFFSDEEHALREFWKAILVAYLSTGLRYKDEHLDMEKGEYCFDLIKNEALRSEDSHVIKLIYSCLSEYQQCQNPLYYFIAKRAVLNDKS
jgi:hypothetical protein